MVQNFFEFSSQQSIVWLNTKRRYIMFKLLLDYYYDDIIVQFKKKKYFKYTDWAFTVIISGLIELFFILRKRQKKNPHAIRYELSRLYL